MATFVSTSSLQKDDSSELSYPDTSSPRKKNSTALSESPDHEETVWWGRTEAKVLAAINDSSGRISSLFLIGHSWCVGPSIFLSWRIMIFVYMVVTLLVLGFKGAFVTSEISIGIYVAQVIASFFTVLSSTMVFLVIRKEKVREGREKVTWPQERLNRVAKRKQQACAHVRRSTNRIKNSVTRTINLLALLFTQNCCALAVFWNIVFWVKVEGTESESVSNHTNDMLLHFYNLIPVLYEIVLGCATFRAVWYVPGAVAVVYLLTRISSTRQQIYGSEWSMREQWYFVGRLLQLFVIFVISCGFLTLTQRARQKLIRYV